MDNEKINMKPYPGNTRYYVTDLGRVLDSETGDTLPIEYTKTQKQYVYLQDEEGKSHLVYMVYILATTFCGQRPGEQYHATLIDKSRGYIAENVMWQSQQEEKAMKTKKQLVSWYMDRMTDQQLEALVKAAKQIRGVQWAVDALKADTPAEAPVVPVVKKKTLKEILEAKKADDSFDDEIMENLIKGE